ncbi:GNAT family N-acetyltransferase [Curtobacterium ammoniigenes]|uniref:GNAT family N-acetyltransferase n=1 Tax=Curtobacterium ammoniigenes TaxID=395387 RepID=UPI00082B0D1B|nr:GNAT family N-acetyltransferase [Curtobacterium ammoniigenes]
MSVAPEIRTPAAGDVDAIASLHVASWQETYRGLIDDSVLDDPTFIDRRRRYWATVTSSTSSSLRARIAIDAGSIVGIALAGSPRDADATWDMELFVLYTDTRVHGTGIGAALLNAAVPEACSASLWVADPNPRAQAFYRKHGFAVDGVTKFDGVQEIRMVRRPSGGPHRASVR